MLTPDTALAYRLDTRQTQLLDAIATTIVRAVWHRPRTEAYCINDLASLPPFQSRWDSNIATSTVKELLSAGLLVRAPEMFTRVSLNSSCGGATPISRLAIPTRDRPCSLSRALRSFLTNAERHGYRVSVLVSSDSRSPGEDRAARAVVDDCQKGSKMPVVYAGIDHKADYAAHLAAKTHVPLDVIQFALSGHGYAGPTMGANRNAVLLRTAGSLLLSADDDTLCDSRRIGQTTDNRLRFMGHGDPADLWFFDDRRSALASTEPADVSVLGAHAAILGKDAAHASDLLHTFDNEERLSPEDVIAIAFFFHPAAGRDSITLV